MMSWSFQLQNINRSFDRIAAWYTEFMNRTETCFKAHDKRIGKVEEQLKEQQPCPCGGPSDEQVERILRRILSEAFSASGIQGPSTSSNGNQFFVKNPKDFPFPRPVAIDPASLTVDPDAVPSKAYAETFKMLEGDLRVYPNMEVDEDDIDDEDIKDMEMRMAQNKRPMFPNSV